MNNNSNIGGKYFSFEKKAIAIQLVRLYEKLIQEKEDLQKQVLREKVQKEVLKDELMNNRKDLI